MSTTKAISKSAKKVAIVTGGASGIGLAITQKFIENNIHTIIIGRDKKKLDDTKKKFGDLCEAISYDLNMLSGIPKLVDELFNRFGNIDILVNNAGINLKK